MGVDSYNQPGGGAVRGAGGQALYRPPQARRQLVQSARTNLAQSKETPPKPRRPDRAVYVPRARRSAPESTENPELPEITQVIKPSSTPTPTQTTPPSKKPLDKNFCNVYKPPHARTNKLPQLNDQYEKPSYSPNLTQQISVQTPEVLTPRVPFYCDDNRLQNQEAIACENDPYSCAVVPANIERVDHLTNDITQHVDESYTPEKETLGFLNHSEPDNCINDNFDSSNNMYAEDNEGVMIMESDIRWQQKGDEDKEHKELKRASEEINRSNRRLIKQSFISDVLIISDPTDQHEENTADNQTTSNNNITDAPKQDAQRAAAKSRFNPDEEDWEAMLDEDGECLEPALLAELTAAVGRVVVQRSRVSCQPAAVPSDAFSHVVEVYNFPSEFTTNDLLSVFSDFKDKGFEIKWVDDNHALVVFSSSKIAAEVLANQHPMVRTRSLQEATMESRQKAKKCAEFLQPYRPRPETCPALARRLVTGALGVKLATASQERLEERRLLSEAREKKRQAALHREAAWDGSLGSC